MSRFRCESLSFVKLILCAFFLVLLGKYTTKLREECGSITDERLRLVQEILTTIKVIKMYTWERFYGQRTYNERK